MLRVEGARVQFGEHAALDGVDLTVGGDETVAVLGPSGCGKTTLLRAIAGLQSLDAGRVSWNGADLAAVPPHERRFGLMFQEYALFPHRDVAGNVEFGLRMAAAARHERRRRVDEMLALVGLHDVRDRRVATLSGGEQQRVALARALAVEPRLLLLDEPLGALDRAWRVRLLAEIAALLDRTHVPAVYVTHDHTEAFTIASHVAVMRAGRVVQYGVPADVWRHPVDVWTARFFGFGAPVTVTVHRGAVETPWCRIPCTPACIGGRAQLVVRPDGVRLGETGAVAATVQRVTFGGALVDVVVHPDAGPPLVASVATRDAPTVGARVHVSFDVDALLLYPPD